MNDEIIDNEFYEIEVVSTKVWREIKRWKYNKICLTYAFIIILLFLFSSQSDSIIIILGITFLYFILRNIAYTFTWLLENLLLRISDFRFNKNIRNFIFLKSIITTFILPTILISIIIEEELSKK